MILTEQTEHFKEYQKKLGHAIGDAAASYIITHSLYCLSVGASDLLGNYLLFPIRRYSSTLLEYKAYLVGGCARHISASVRGGSDSPGCRRWGACRCSGPSNSPGPGTATSGTTWLLGASTAGSGPQGDGVEAQPGSWPGV